MSNLNQTEKEKAPKQKSFKLPRLPKLSNSIKLSLATLILVIIGIFGFYKISAQLRSLTDIIEEVQIDDFSKQELAETSSEEEQIANNSGSGESATNQVVTKKPETQSCNCKDYAEILSYVVNLKQKFDKGESFQKEIVLLSLATKNDPNITKYLGLLDPYAESGVPNLSSLVSEFNDIQDEIIIASRLTEEAKNWKYKLLQLFSKFIFVKKVGARALRGGGIDMTIEKVKVVLQEEDLLSAIDELKTITNPNTEKLVSIWVQHAQDNLEAGRQVNELYEFIFTKINCEFRRADPQNENVNDKNP